MDDTRVAAALDQTDADARRDHPGAFESRTSLEKLDELLERVGELEPDGTEEAVLHQALGMVGPMARRKLGDDPAKLDRYLLAGARMALALRSDEAEVDAELLVDEPEVVDGEVIE